MRELSTAIVEVIVCSFATISYCEHRCALVCGVVFVCLCVCVCVCAEKAASHKDLAACPLLVLANKQDLKNAMNMEQIAAMLQLHNYDAGPNKRPYRVQPITALTG